MTRVWHHHWSDTSTSPGAILLHSSLLGCIEIWVTLYLCTFKSIHRISFNLKTIKQLSYTNIMIYHNTSKYVKNWWCQVVSISESFATWYYYLITPNILLTNIGSNHSYFLHFYKKMQVVYNLIFPENHLISFTLTWKC